jgi:hypothetical protein
MSGKVRVHYPRALRHVIRRDNRGERIFRN